MLNSSFLCGPSLILTSMLMLQLPWGIGLMVGDRWVAWSLCKGWKAAGWDIGWAESIALELAILWIISQDFSDSEIIIHSNNTSVVSAFNKGHSRNIARNDSISLMTSLLVPANILIKPIYVSSSENKADPVSWGSFPDFSLNLRCLFQLPPELQPFLSHVSTPSWIHSACQCHTSWRFFPKFHRRLGHPSFSHAS